MVTDNTDQDELPGFVSSQEVKEDKRVRIPDELYNILFHDESNPNIFWGYETNKNIAFFRRGWISDPGIEVIGYFDVYSSKRIRIPDDIAEETEIGQEEGVLIYFFTYGDAREEGKVYVLSELQAWQLLPVDELPDDGVKEVVIHEQPGFLSSVR